ncbi:plasmid stabilization protein [Candidatus Peregrinibacteria bacterium RIFOXYB12_FULL_41_12]|nr:MAG: plasmid stabilization protein [Candidatus Peregrinibacteria bacterium RIFOXYB12_FULL_41_12]OGJ52552.1 MAG: plasmid stabilization protein [Candidatus Peregrinibacteria bacterium RIFOXYC2_FULL_41_22]
MAKLIFTESYERRARKFIKKHPELIEHYGKVLRLLELNPNHPSLRLHKLKGRLSSLSSVSINYAYRITLKFLIKDDTIIPIDIGQHDEVY